MPLWNLQDWADYLPFDDVLVRVGCHRLSLFTILSYLLDWLLYIIILVISIVYGRLGIPRSLEFDPSDRALLWSYVQERDTFAPIWILLIFSLVLPIGYFALISFIFTSTRTLAKQLWNFHSALLALTGALAYLMFMVSCIKNVASVPRPDFLSRCNFNPGASSQTLQTIESCLQTSTSLLYEGFRSFPSGHAATIFAACTVQSLFGSSTLGLYDKRGLSWKFILAVAGPLTVALVITFSRVSDHRHRVVDVAAGAIIGTVAGASVFLMYFPLAGRRRVGNAFFPRRFYSAYNPFWKIGVEEKQAQQRQQQSKPFTQRQPDSARMLTV